MSIELTLKDLTKDCAVGAGMAVYVWHCDRDGNYSLYGKDAAEQNYLRGVQVADEQGRVFFTSIFPACYTVGGRTSTSRSSTHSSPPWPATTPG